MSRAFLGGFVVIAAVAVGAVDYVNQARRAGSAPAAFGISSYLQTITGRFGDQQAALAAERTRNELLAQEPRSFLPAPPDGWTRGDWGSAGEALFGKRYDMAEDDFVPEAMKGDPTLKALNALDKAQTAQKDASEVYLYQKPDATVALRITHLPKPGSGGIAGGIIGMVGANIEAMSGKEGFAVVKGVTFREEFGIMGTGAEDRRFRVFSATLGNRIRISARAVAEDADVIALLEGIDYDRLNLMLEVLVEGIGSAAPEMTAAQARAFASANVATAAQDQRLQAAEQEIRMQETALEVVRRTSKMSDEDYQRAKAKLAERRAALAAMTGQLETPTRVASAPEATGAPAAPTGGVLGMLGGLFGGGADTPQEADSRTAAPVVSSGGFRRQLQCHKRRQALQHRELTAQSVSTVEPVVWRASSARCAAATSASAKRWPISILTAPEVTLAKSRAAIS